jgi:hypothetical protein
LFYSHPGAVKDLDEIIEEAKTGEWVTITAKEFRESVGL